MTKPETTRLARVACRLTGPAVRRLLLLAGLVVAGWFLGGVANAYADVDPTPVVASVPTASHLLSPHPATPVPSVDDFSRTIRRPATVAEGYTAGRIAEVARDGLVHALSLWPRRDADPAHVARPAGHPHPDAACGRSTVIRRGPADVAGSRGTSTSADPSAGMRHAGGHATGRTGGGTRYPSPLPAAPQSGTVMTGVDSPRSPEGVHHVGLHCEFAEIHGLAARVLPVAGTGTAAVRLLTDGASFSPD